MPSDTNALGDILKRFESLLLPSGGDRSTGSSLIGNGLSGVLGAVSGNGSDQSLTQRLTEGILGGPVGLLTGLFSSLFRGDSEKAPVFTPFEKPESLFLQYDVAAAPADPGVVSLSPAQNSLSETPAASADTNRTVQPSVVVQVNAMDAQSFSTRSDEIASAVREALSRNHALRDEIWED